jgi:L-threonylcarbamoyladenylate synthase
VRASLQPATDSALREAASVVRAGGLIAFPTETFYGLGVTPFDKDAVHRLLIAKGRSRTTGPILVLIRAPEELRELVTDIDPNAELLIKACWPGPLTLVFRAQARLPELLTAGTGTVGVRVSASPLVQRLLASIGGPLTGTSANRSGASPAVTARDVEQSLGAVVDLIVDGGPAPGGLPSTVVDTTVVPVRLVREGCVSRSTLLSVVGTLAA